jgi:hypothetical protein
VLGYHWLFLENSTTDWDLSDLETLAELEIAVVMAHFLIVYNQGRIDPRACNSHPAYGRNAGGY